MHLLRTLLYLFHFVLMANGLANQGAGGGAGGDAKTSSNTIVWITTTIDGKLTTASTTFSQTFMSTYTEANSDDVESGTVGMGSLSGSVGTHRSYDQTTISNAAPDGAAYVPYNLYAGFVGGIAVLLGLF
ncbi:Pga1 GPI-anchored protein [Candida orthopsilosis Co 90-125]|uniref:Pga1 GPI-anchored protein n=1 Tax=Candida orthopsilosis (strain 90-125) TaxID=1136231 RepID=H8X4F2_CANO9|nr:Pga1 GPI-anchored protein [Candida orthopsilosis Co 90-125]CCG22894.1 Pga1 GPI-anchored protein [Candida orthopsilosis Co 90-125]